MPSAIGWRILRWPLDLACVLLWNTSFLLMGASNWFGKYALRVHYHIDPVGVEWRHQEIMRFTEQMLEDERAKEKA